MRKFITFILFSLVIIFFIKSVFYSKSEINFALMKNALYSFFYQSNLKVRDISFFNLKNLNEDDLKKIIPIKIGDSIFNINFKKIEDKLIKKNEINSLKISLTMKGDLNIYIQEEIPFMFWFDNEKKVLINRNGKVLNYDISKYKNLRFIKGEYAKDNIKSLYDHLIQFDEIFNRFNSAEYVENYRWNIKFNDNTLIELPIFKIEKSLKILNNLLREGKIDNYKFIDLRIDGRISFK
jgi:cell division septal protein FtsQ